MWMAQGALPVLVGFLLLLGAAWLAGPEVWLGLGFLIVWGAPWVIAAALVVVAASGLAFGWRPALWRIAGLALLVLVPLGHLAAEGYLLRSEWRAAIRDEHARSQAAGDILP